MALMTVAELRTHIETELDDAAIQALMDGAEYEITRRHGPNHADAPVIVTLHGGKKYLTVTRPVSTVTSIKEYDRLDNETTLAADDYRIRYGGIALERVNLGTNPSPTWGERVEVQYTPEDDTALRKRVLIALVRLDMQYNGLRQESLGEYSRTSVTDLRGERELILSALHDPRASGVMG